MPWTSNVTRGVRDATAMEDLVSTIEEGDAQAVRDALRAKGSMDANVSCDDLTTKHPKNRPIHIAAELGFAEIVEILLDHGASADSQNYDQRTPCHLAAHFGHVNVLTKLFDWNVDLTKENKFSNQPLHEAAFNGHSYAVQALIGAGADVNARGNHSWTPLHLACMSSHPTSHACEILTRAGADLFATGDLLAYTPLHWAAAKNKGKCVTAILNNVSPSVAAQALNHGNTHGDTPLRVATTANAKDSSKAIMYFTDNQSEGDVDQPGHVSEHGLASTDMTSDPPYEENLSRPISRDQQHDSRPSENQTNQNTNVSRNKGKQGIAGTRTASQDSKMEPSNDDAFEHSAEESKHASGSIASTKQSVSLQSGTTPESRTNNGNTACARRGNPDTESTSTQKPKKKKTTRGSLIKERMKMFTKKEDTTQWAPVPRKRRPSSKNDSIVTSQNTFTTANVSNGVADKSLAESRLSTAELNSIEKNLESVRPDAGTVRRMIAVIRHQERHIRALENQLGVAK
eukprot:gb/GECG01014027.1/.p1 GENE.gb/GECG01014027.1/~~gb/GECG01014027.1/.p1  ORF type:complete len:515 (+),score=71.90 gb/GECG01014027.1/:1-1545(+)